MPNPQPERSQEDEFSALSAAKGSSMVHFVADYAPGDLAIAEVLQALAKEVPETWREHVTSVESFNTIETGFVIAQLALQSDALRPENLLVYANCAPRSDTDKARTDNEGEGLVYGILKNGVKIVAVNSEYSLSLLREEFAELHSVTVGKQGSQFRSRDFYPAVVGQVARNEDLSEILGAKLDPLAVIPKIPGDRIGYVDSFGNLKTTIRESDERFQGKPDGTRFKIEINGIDFWVTLATGSFSVREGDIAFAPGSSGHEDRFLEIFQRRGNAWATFKKPRVGAPIEFKDVD